MISKQLRKNVLNAFSVSVAGVIALTPVDTLASEGETPMSTIEYDIPTSEITDDQTILEAVTDDKESGLVIIEDEPVPVAVSVDVKGNVKEAAENQRNKIIVWILAFVAVFTTLGYNIYNFRRKKR